MDHSIYGLKEPNKKIRYVGVTNDPQARLDSHLASQKHAPVNNWIQSLLAKGITPEMVILETCSEQDRDARERHWIMLTDADLNVLGKEQDIIGKVGRLDSNGISFDVTIVQAKHAFGNLRFQVTPVSGTGMVWVDSNRVQFDADPTQERIEQ